MAISSYLSVQTSQQGELKGDEGKKKGIPILGYSLGVEVPRAVGSGQATGKRVYEPLTVYKNAGSATPQLFQALVANEQLPKVVVTVYRTAKNGKDEVYLSVTLHNARIARLQHDPDEFAGEIGLESIEFTFEKIEIENHFSGVKTADQLTPA